jgi:predicted enzyme involved in methoxymalonyl-ACP biosynthesis
MDMTRDLNSEDKVILLKVWNKLQELSRAKLSDHIKFVPSESLLSSYSQEQIKNFIGILREANTLKITDTIYDHGFFKGYFLELLRSEFHQVGNELLSSKSEGYKKFIQYAQNVNTSKTILKFAEILFSDSQSKNFLLAKQINKKLKKNEYKYDNYKERIKNRFKTLDKYLKKVNLRTSLQRLGSRIVSLS